MKKKLIIVIALILVIIYFITTYALTIHTAEKANDLSVMMKKSGVDDSSCTSYSTQLTNDLTKYEKQTSKSFLNIFKGEITGKITLIGKIKELLKIKERIIKVNNSTLDTIDCVLNP